jgi:hypothetical protein
MVTFLVGGGAAALVTTVVKAVGSMRIGSRTASRGVVRDAVEARRDAERRLEHEKRVSDYWRGVAGNYNYQLRSNGIMPDPAKPVPPVVRVKTEARSRRDIQELEDTLSGLRIDEDNGDGNGNGGR